MPFGMRFSGMAALAVVCHMCCQCLLSCLSVSAYCPACARIVSAYCPALSVSAYCLACVFCAYVVYVETWVYIYNLATS